MLFSTQSNKESGTTGTFRTSATVPAVLVVPVVPSHNLKGAK